MYISEVTVAELEYGNKYSGRYDENRELMDKFLSMVNVVPFSVSITDMQRKGTAFVVKGLLSPTLTY